MRERAHARSRSSRATPAELDDSEREQIGDYLLAQQGPAERLVTYDELEGSPAGRAFAQAVAHGSSQRFQGRSCPEIPGAAEALPRRGARRRTVAATEDERGQAAGFRRQARSRAGRPAIRVIGRPLGRATPQSEREPRRSERRASAEAGCSGRSELAGRWCDRAGLIVVGAIVAIVLSEHLGRQLLRGREGAVLDGRWQQRRDGEHRRVTGAPEQAA